MNATLEARFDQLFAEIDDASNKVGSNMVDFRSRLCMLLEEPGANEYVWKHRRELDAKLDGALGNVARSIARLAALCLLVYTPSSEDMDPMPDVRLARGGPATEIALIATYLLRHAGEIVPLDFGDGPLEEAPDPDFSNYHRVFGAFVDQLSTASYYLLDPLDTQQALASSPPELEMFPPLPFPRVWIEMTHLTPLRRLRDMVADSTFSEEIQALDLLGIGITEVEQGRVWDVYLPLKFTADTQFTVAAGRIAPDRIVQFDDSFQFGDLSFTMFRSLAIGIAHLITARNAPPEPLLLPRHQRKRLPERRKDSAERLYYVNLHTAGDSHGGGGGSGQSGREYHVRWLVRGHWRHTPGGRTFCTCCETPQRASWIAPYIKGPAGAPWKGKQVHRG